MEIFKLFGSIAVNNGDANSAIDDTTGRAEGAQGRMSSAFAKIGAAVAGAFAVDKIIDFGREIVNVSATVAAEQSAFEQIMGDYSSAAAEKVDKIADATVMVNSRLTPYMTSMTAKFKGLGYDIDDATDLAQTGLTIAADAAAFWDKSLEDSMGALNSFVNGNYEGGESIGLFANETTLASWAAENLGYKWADLTEKEKQFTRLEFAKAMQEASGASGQAAKESEQYANVQANLNEKWRQFKAEIGEPLLQNIVLPAMEKLSGLVDKASGAYETLKSKLQTAKEWFERNRQAIDTVVTGVSIAISAFAALKAGMVVAKAVQGFQQAQLAIRLLTMEIGSANLAQAALNGTMSIGQTIVALLTGKMTLAQLATGLMTKAQAALNATMLLNPITLVIAAIVALVAAFVILWNRCEGFRNFWINLWEDIKASASAAWNELKAEIEILVAWFRETWNAFSEFFKNLWNGIRAMITGIWSSISSTVSGIVNGVRNYITTAFNNVRDTISNALNTAKNIVANIFSTIKNTISDKINGARDTVRNAIEKIKSFFNFSWNLPKLKLPHINISGSFSLVPPRAPSFSIDWYKQGGIMTEPTMFDYNPATGKAKVGGEAGDEAIAPIDTLLDYVRVAVQEENGSLRNVLGRIMDILAEYLPVIPEIAKLQLVTDTGALVGELAPQMDSKLGDIHDLRKRGR